MSNYAGCPWRICEYIFTPCLSHVLQIYIYKVRPDGSFCNHEEEKFRGFCEGSDGESNLPLYSRQRGGLG